MHGVFVSVAFRNEPTIDEDDEDDEDDDDGPNENRNQAN